MSENKAAFVKALGAALAYSRAGVIDLDYNKDPDGFEAVTVLFADGERTVNVTGKSCLAIMHDVYKALVRGGGMTHKQKIRARMLYENDILTPLKRRRKAVENMKALTKEKIEEVKALIGTGATRKEVAEKAGVGLATIDRIKAGQLTAEGRADKPAKPKVDKPEPETAQELITPRELDALRALIGQAVKAFAGIECATAADSYNLGQTFGLLTAAQMLLEGEP